MGVRIRIENHSKEAEAEIEKAIERALEKMGLLAEAHAKLNLEKDPRRIDTGHLRNSITHTAIMDNGIKKEAIGTNVLYGKYVEYGTGIYVEDGTGRQTPWFVVGEQGRWNGVGFWTRGMRPNHFLKKAATEHRADYERILREELDNM